MPKPRHLRKGPRFSTRLGGVLSAASVVTGLLSSGGAVWRASAASLDAGVINSGNTWEGGTVTLVAGGAGSSVLQLQTADLVPEAGPANLVLSFRDFSSSGAAKTPGGNVAGAQGCMEVIYTGTIPAVLSVGSSLQPSSASTLGSTLLFAVQVGTDSSSKGDDPSCATFTPNSGGGYIYGAGGTSTLEGFLTSPPSGSVAVSPGQAVWYRFGWLLSPSAPQTAQGASEQANVTFYATST